MERCAGVTGSRLAGERVNQGENSAGWEAGGRSKRAFAVDQVDAKGAFDEHKVLLGFMNRQEARAGYAKHFPPGFNQGRPDQGAVNQQAARVAGRR
ncbi:hypothetical protein [Variovorax humicola]|uniref:hypothetical protein n=1 Tax=Variovorax humicola TaxID=1769758 RepID=UPI003BF58472